MSSRHTDGIWGIGVFENTSLVYQAVCIGSFHEIRARGVNSVMALLVGKKNQYVRFLHLKNSLYFLFLFVWETYLWTGGIILPP
jgi:hypothetical protein